MKHSTLTIVLLLLMLATASICTAELPQSQEVYSQTVQPFLKAHCFKCHDAREALAGLRLDQIGSDFQADKNAEMWKEVMDKINLGEMPPKEERQPGPAEFEPVIRWINTSLLAVELAAKNAGGRIPMRRLNRVEYANSVRDLLYMDPKVLFPLVEELPGNGKAEGFDRLGVALFFDQTQMERTIAVAERIAARSIVDDEPQLISKRYEFEDNPRVARFKTKARTRFADTLVDAGPSGFDIINGGVRFVHGYGNRPKENPGGRMGGSTFDEVITQDGYYRIRLLAGASEGSRGEPIKVRAVYAANTPVELATTIVIEAPLDAPKVHEAVIFLRSGPEGLKRGVNFSFNDITDLIVTTPENSQLYREVREARDALRQANTQGGSKAEIAAASRAYDGVQARAAQWKGPLRYYNPMRDHKNPPTIFVDWVEVSGPVLPEWPPKSHKSVLFDGDERQDQAYVGEVFARFLPRAYRRSVTDAEVDGVVTLVEQARGRGVSFHDAMRMGLARVLCSPGFLFIQEPAVDTKPRKLTDHELASRLSYFLWSSMPDEELFTLAEAGRLHEPQVLMAQADRLLNSPKAEALVSGFAGQWLDIREFGSVMPAAEYRDNYDSDLEQSSRLEAYAFFREVLSKDLPVTSFLNSSFVMINERLARHYHIDGVEGSDIRRVNVEPQHHRGGVLGMAGLMTYLSDGTRTLPVRRAAWVKTQLFDDPPSNPPPNAGEIQPNTGGRNLTVRQRLDLHRNNPTCASCHIKLDPFGIALENYDAVGMWRTKANGEGFRSKNAPELNVSGAFPNGETFKSLEDYKAGLLIRKDQFTRNLVKQVMTYALTRPVGYADHQTVDAIAEAVVRDDYRLRTLIKEVVRSELFQSR